MKIQSRNKTAIFAAMTLASAITVPLANAASNPFSNTELASGFNLEHAADTKAGGDEKHADTSKCAEGKCGEDCIKKDANGKSSAADKAAAEGKCGEGKCGENMSSDEGDAKPAK